MNRYLLLFYLSLQLIFNMFTSFVISSCTTEFRSGIVILLLILGIFLETIYYLKTAFYIWKLFYFFLILLLFLKYFLRMCTWWDTLFCSQYCEDNSHCPQASVAVEKLLESQGLNNAWSFENSLPTFSHQLSQTKSPCYLWYPDEPSYQ